MAAQATAFPEGIFSSVHESRETGDLGGLELRLFRSDERLMAEVVLCEGWCNVSHIVPVRLVDGRYRLRFVEHYEGSGGGDDLITEVELLPAGNAFRARLSSPGQAEASSWDDAFRLRPLKQPYGLAVAHHGGEPGTP
ncbi:hypothetical protein [Sphingomonas sp. IC081]|uniref:hypothetical protein n=1 Tax=Sphingomonas sp. IC081 TaxID=304378 RepID=UPI00115ADAE1|nr:hypothetical protein [Sphingomonas sp. IC081]QDK31939.1 hypothetical protein DM450_03885 [Sphingomonas sp. IC081]